MSFVAPQRCVLLVVVASLLLSSTASFLPGCGSAANKCSGCRHGVERKRGLMFTWGVGGGERMSETTRNNYHAALSPLPLITNDSPIHRSRTSLSLFTQGRSSKSNEYALEDKSKVSLLETDSVMTEEKEENNFQDENKNEIIATAEIDLPFTANVAFDAFANLPRQPTWSSWLKSVEYIEDENDTTMVDKEEEEFYSSPSIISQSSHPPTPPLRDTLWTLGFRGLTFSWTAKSTALDRPHRIDWESTSGLRNMGSVRFVEITNDDSQEIDMNGRTEDRESAASTTPTSTKMTLSMKFVTPRLVAAMFRRSSAIRKFVEDKMLMKTLVKFRQVVMEEDL